MNMNERALKDINNAKKSSLFNVKYYIDNSNTTTSVEKSINKYRLKVIESMYTIVHIIYVNDFDLF